MADTVTQMQAEQVKEAVSTFKTEANNLRTALEEAKNTITNRAQQTSSIWITDYAGKFTKIFSDEVSAAVEEIITTAGQVEEIAGLITKEDQA